MTTRRKTSPTYRDLLAACERAIRHAGKHRADSAAHRAVAEAARRLAARADGRAGKATAAPKPKSAPAKPAPVRDITVTVTYAPNRKTATIVVAGAHGRAKDPIGRADVGYAEGHLEGRGPARREWQAYATNGRTQGQSCSTLPRAVESWVQYGLRLSWKRINLVIIDPRKDTT